MIDVQQIPFTTIQHHHKSVSLTTTKVFTGTASSSSTSTSISSSNSSSSINTCINCINYASSNNVTIESNASFASSSTSTSSESSQFIEINDLENLMSKDDCFWIILDCRLLKEYEAKHIKDSVHINCRDRITKNRLSSKKLSVRDIISCEKTKKKLDNSLIGSDNQQESSCFNKNSNNLTIVLYDDATNDSNDLYMQSNPLKIVLDNIINLFKDSKCKILKGGFCEFSKKYPQFCVNEENELKTKSAQLNEIQAARLLLYGEDQHKHSIENAQLTKIDSHLYLGNERDARNIENLSNEGIFYILNVTKNIPLYHENNGLFKYKRIAVNDSCGENLKNHFDEAFKFIDEAKKNNSKVLVHCQAGVSRSPTITIAYLMRTKNLKMQEAYSLVKEKRQIIDPNLVFMNQLDDYQSYLNENNNNNNNKTSINDVTPATPSINNTSNTRGFDFNTINNRKEFRLEDLIKNVIN